jgi:beta-lactamase regulating signal transducer with metallopeptidase domain
MTLLLSVSLKIALLLLAALTATAFLQRRSAAVRHWLLATALFACLCMPALESLTPAWTVRLPSSWSFASSSSSLRFVSETTEPPATTHPTVSEDLRPSRLTGMPNLATVLAAIWLGGTALGLATLVGGLARLRTLAAESEPMSSGPWRDAANELSQRYGIHRSLRLLCCRYPTMLATWGVVRPTIVLPEEARSWASERVHAVLHHELAHVARGDWIVALTADLLRSVYWFNPLLWIACRRLRHEAERACDDLVLTSGISGSEYATHLLNVARESVHCRDQWSPAIAVAHHSMLEGRVRAMLDARLNREPLTVFTRAATIVVLACVTVPIGVITVSGHTETASARDRVTPSGTLPLRPAVPETPSAERRILHTSPGQAQTAGGTIEGVLYDQFGGLLPGASVKLTAVAAGGSQSTLTNRGGSFVFKGVPAGDYELVTDLPGFVSVRNVVRAEPGGTVRRHITLPIGAVEEIIHVTCAASDLRSRPTAPTGAATPGPSRSQATGQRGAEPKIPGTFTGGIGGQIKVPSKLLDVRPICPASTTQESSLVRLAGRIGIDGLITDLRDVSSGVQPAYVASAMEAARQWAFTPTLLNGAPIEVNITVNVSYAWN